MEGLALTVACGTSLSSALPSLSVVWKGQQCVYQVIASVEGLLHGFQFEAGVSHTAMIHQMVYLSCQNAAKIVHAQQIMFQNVLHDFFVIYFMPFIYFLIFAILIYF